MIRLRDRSTGVVVSVPDADTAARLGSGYEPLDPPAAPVKRPRKAASKE